MENEDRKIAVVNRHLENLDKQLQELIDAIIADKQIYDSESGKGSTTETGAMKNFIRTINAIRIDGNEKVLVAISRRYEKAINLLNTEIGRDDDNEYKEQLKAELDRLLDNKSTRFDPVSETYQELATRLERGEAQRNYYQNKADVIAAKMKKKEKDYKSKNGNIDIVLAELEEPISRLERKKEIKRKYEELKKINNHIKKLEEELKDPNLSDEDKAKKGEKLNSLKEKRKSLAEEFEKTATDKDGNKYKREDGKTDEEYIDGLDKTKIEAAIEEMAKAVQATLNNMPEEDRLVTFLGLDMKEDKRATDLAKYSDLDKVDGIEELLEALRVQKQLWNDKAREDGYDKTKLQQEFENYSKQARGELTEPTTVALGETKTSFWERFRHNRKSNGVFKSFFKSFARGKTETKMREEYAKNYEEFDQEEAKKHALKYLEKNKEKLTPLRERDKKHNEELYRRQLKVNVDITQADLNAFWDKKRAEAQKDKGREH